MACAKSRAAAQIDTGPRSDPVEADTQEGAGRQ